MKIMSAEKETCFRKRNLRFLPYRLSRSFPDCADETACEPQRKMQFSPGKVGSRAETAVSDLPGPGSAGCPRGARGAEVSRPARGPVAPHTLDTARVCSHKRARSYRLGHPRPPRGHPQPRKGHTVPGSTQRGGAERREKEGEM